MTESVLVPLDASPLSTQALEHACDQYPDATITALHVLDFTDVAFSGALESTLPGYWEEWYEQALDETDDLFDEARRTAEDVGVALETERLVGPPARSIVDFADEADVDHVVMGSHGRSGLSRILLGSVAETVIRRAPCPVTVVR